MLLRTQSSDVFQVQPKMVKKQPKFPTRERHMAIRRKKSTVTVTSPPEATRSPEQRWEMGEKVARKKSEYFGSDPSQLFMSYWGGNYRLMDCPAAHKSILIGHQSFGIRLGRERRKPNRFHFDFGISAVLHKFTLCGIRFFFCACPFSAAKSECWKSQIKLNNRLQ